MADPVLHVHSPWGDESEVGLTPPVTWVGRPVSDSRPEVALEPDPRRWVSNAHCALRRHGNTWTAADGGSVNGTWVRRQDRCESLTEPWDLRHGDEILVLGDLGADGEPLYWSLLFDDPNTLPAPPLPAPPRRPAEQPPSLEYVWSSAQVFRRIGGAREEITSLRPKIRTLVRHMVERAEHLGTSAVLCTHEELLSALFGDRAGWGPDDAWDEQDVRGVVSDARRAIEPDPARPVILQTVRSMGYRLNVWGAGSHGSDQHWTQSS